MRITAVEPIVHRADRVDTTRADGTQDAFLVRIHTDEGHVGIGEADTSPYLARTMIEMPSSRLIARGLREVLMGEDQLEIDRLWHVMYRATYHYGRGGVALHVISAIDMALWDLAGQGRRPAGLRPARRCAPAGGAGLRKPGDARDGRRGAHDRRGGRRRRLPRTEARLGPARAGPGP
jgi:hypothetical protein